MTTQIKIGKNVIEVKQGDYILDNTKCIQFVAGDNRPLTWKNETSLLVSKSVLKSIDLGTMNKKEYKGCAVYMF